MTSASAYRHEAEAAKLALEPTTVKSKIRKREVIAERRDHILILTITRPQRRNALNRNAVYDLIAAFGEATHNEEINAVVLTGCGDIFSAGNDLKQMQDYVTPDDYYRGANYVLRSLVKSVLVCPKITICLVNGPCIGIGFTLAALFDVVYCTRSAYFQAPFTKLGICAEACSSLTFPQLFGQSWATKLLLFGEQLTAEKAEQLGFVAEIFESQTEVQEKFWPKVNEYTRLPCESVRATKRLMQMHNRQQLLKALEEELRCMTTLRTGPVHQKAIEEFLQKSKSFPKSKL
ncbi:enoyl-CoA delta isomerase 3, peroxisomal-like [Haematobia irritans]|uniref:enoyl-CoA delta isomerase 3, peroxisomal-like n=1 Tax=Haematobia irritans TaxID=7368 RepID=UPI003F4FD73F